MLPVGQKKKESCTLKSFKTAKLRQNAAMYSSEEGKRVEQREMRYEITHNNNKSNRNDNKTKRNRGETSRNGSVENHK